MTIFWIMYLLVGFGVMVGTHVNYPLWKSILVGALWPTTLGVVIARIPVMK